MTKVLISEKYLHDIANAIRVKLDSQSTYTPAQMAAAIADITGSISGTITPSTDADKVLVTDSNLTAIANAIRAKLDVATLYTPAQMAEAILSITASTPMPTIVSWASGTDAEIGALIDAAHAGTVDLQQDAGWAVGDVRTISISAFTGGGNVAHAAQDIDIVITSFEEYMGCGNVMQFDFKNVLINAQKMNGSNSTSGGYGASMMKTVTLPALVNALPSWLNSRLIEFSALTSAGNGSSTIETVQGNKLALRSEIEATGGSTNSYTGEGILIQYYSSASNRKKKKINGSYNKWWLRSPYNAGNQYYCALDGAGNGSPTQATSAIGLAPFGCL